MNKIQSNDVFSLLNPSFCSIIVYDFIKNYESEKSKGCFLPLVYTVLPIVMSSDINKTLNRKTISYGLNTWLGDNPEVLIDIDKKITSSKKITEEAVVFALNSGILGIDNNGKITTNKDIPKNKLNKNVELKKYIKYSRLLGSWYREMDDSQILYSLGVIL